MKVLIADDDPVSRRLLESDLRKWGYEVAVANDGLEAWKTLQSPGAPRLVLLDWLMPGMDGIEVCQEVRKRTARGYTYILLLTSKNDKQDIVAGLESGADDYLTKPFHPRELLARLRVGKRVLDLEDNLVAAQEVLQFKATHDHLTGVWNRAAILDRLQRELPRARREGSHLGLLLGDLDHFKAINDNYGHPAGDAVLQETVRRMLASVRVYDAVGRYGGEEFLILLPGCDFSTTRERAEQIRAAIGDREVDTPKGRVRVTLSLGGLSSRGWRAGEIEALLRAADEALYRAKSAGRNRVEMATPAETASAEGASNAEPVALEKK